MNFNYPKIYLSILTAVLIFSNPSAALAHHILGIPHYAYDEAYPQTPVLTYLVEMGPHEVKMTGYPGRPQPGERCSLHVYIRDLDSGASFKDGVSLTLFLDKMIGDDPVVYGPIEAELEEAVFKFYPKFEKEANYLVRIEYDTGGEAMIIDLPMVVGEPGSPWMVIGGVACGVILFLVVIRAIRIKLQRRDGASAENGEAAALSQSSRESIAS